MAKKKRIYKTLFGIPVWIILGLAVFILLSAGYDWFVGDRNTMRYLLIGASGVIILLTILLHLTKVETVAKMAGRQLGG